MAEERPNSRRGGARKPKRRPSAPKTEAPQEDGTDETATAVAVAEKVRSLDLSSLYKMTNQELITAAKELDIAGFSTMRKQELIFEVMKAESEQSGLVFAEGVLQILQDGYGFLRHPV